VPIVPDPSRPDGRRLVTSDGTSVARFLEIDRDGRRVADLLEPIEDADVDAIAAADLRGWSALALGTIAVLPALSLAVTDGNPAVRVYDALGFERVLTSFSVELDPGALRS
jgi:hypothetical protein